VLVSAITIASSAGIAAPQPSTPPKPAEEIQLEQFLADKDSPIPADTLFQYPNWKTILAVANAESGYGLHMAGAYNAWGIVDFQPGSKRYGKTRSFASWDESLAYTSTLLFKYDTTDGMPDPLAMVARWKYQRPFTGWLANVNYALHDIDVHTTVDVAAGTNTSLL